MKVYNGRTIGANDTIPALSHFSANPVAGAQRIESMFTALANHRYTLNADLSIALIDPFNREVARTPLEPFLHEFCDHASKCVITECELETKQTLRIQDLWEDDPIGSGGIGVFANPELNHKQVSQLVELFAPFNEVLYPQFIYSLLSNNDLKRIKNAFSGNALFKAEMQKRKQRSQAIGESWDAVKPHEMVWVAYTLKARQWALENGYDSFVYSNHKEGAGEDSFVTLLPNQLSEPTATYHFDKEKYLSTSRAGFQKMVDDIERQRHSPFFTPPTVFHVLWAGMDPMTFWKKSESTEPTS